MNKIQERVYWAWFRKHLPYAGATAHSLLSVYGTASEIFHAAKSGFDDIRGFSPEEKNGLVSAANEKELEICWTTLQANKIGVVLRSDRLYPKQLLELHDPPLMLYMRGCKQALDKKDFLTIVGSRNTSQKGAETTHNIADEFARAGGCVVSGFAQGIDKAAHLGAISRSEHATIAVLASGVLKENCHEKNFYDELLENGLFISENPPEYQYKSWTFPERNRIMAALSNATLVVEARNKSGVQHTVSAALDLGKDVYAIPGNIDEPTSQLPNSLIKDGAKICTSIDDILVDYPELSKAVSIDYSFSSKEKTAIPETVIKFTDIQALIVGCIGNEGASVDSIVAKSGLDITTILRELSMLMLDDIIDINPATNKYYLTL